jgi:hypothetical protein
MGPFLDSKRPNGFRRVDSIIYWFHVGHHSEAAAKRKPHLLLRNGVLSSFWVTSVKGSTKAIVKIQEATMALPIYFGNPNSFPLPRSR